MASGSNSSSGNRTLTLGGFWTFFVFGLVDNLRGPLLPEMLRGGQLNYAQAGTIVLAGYIGFILATLGTGLLADRLSNRLVLWLAGWCLACGFIGIGLTQQYAALVLCMGLIGLGLGAIELGANALMVQLHSHERGKYLNLLSVFHGCGSLLIPLVAARLIAWQWSWNSIYMVCLCLCVPILTVFWPALHSQISSELASASASEHSSRTTIDQALRICIRPAMLIYYVLIGTYVAVELSVGTWMMEYLQQELKLSIQTSSQYLSAFFVLLMCGRLIGAGLIERLNYLMVVGVLLVATGLCLSTVLLIQKNWIVLLPVSGLCMSVIFPTVTALVSHQHAQGSAFVMGILFAAGGLGGALGPWAVGLVSQSTNLHHGMLTILGFNLMSLVALIFVWRMDSKH